MRLILALVHVVSPIIARVGFFPHEPQTLKHLPVFLPPTKERQNNNSGADAQTGTDTDKNFHATQFVCYRRL